MSEHAQATGQNPDPGLSSTRTLQLTPNEQRLKTLLLDVAAHADKTRGPDTEPLVLRWAGGWVRDKLLGVESHDIDTAINAMTGYAFSLLMRDFCAVPTNVSKHDIMESDLGSLHRIAANPDKSKHLETATTRIFGLDVDFVNLRKETYTNDSRNPQMEFGTAKEDALRRDATVNALFYNLHTNQVEDFTGGLRDFESRLIRTPLEPFQTFMDDPLRVLRLVRFSSRLGFTIDPAARDTMGNPRVLDALSKKISRERIGVEIEKMLTGKHPRDALQLINSLGLYHAIFTDPNRTTFPRPPLSGWDTAYECLDHLQKSRGTGSIYDTLVQSDEAAQFAWILASVTPWESLAETQPEVQRKGQLPLPAQVLREGIKGTNKLCDVVTASHRHRQDILEKKRSVSGDGQSPGRDWYGMAIRRWNAQGGHWRLQVLYALLVEAMAGQHNKSRRDFPAFLDGWKKFLDHLEELDVLEAASLKRLVDGSMLAKALNRRPGKWMAAALDVCVEWQLRHPGETDPSGAIDEVRRRGTELGIPDH